MEPSIGASYQVSVHLANDPGCICGCASEDAIHYILECCLYNEAREELKLRLVFLNEIKIEVIYSMI
jgi:hypothetical protein